MMVFPKMPKILDIKTLDIDVDKKREIKVTELKCNDPFQLKVIEVPDVYRDPVAVRTLALEIPSVFANEMTRETGFPGWRGVIGVDQLKLYQLIHNTLLEHLPDEYGGPFTQELNFPFMTGLVNTKSIIRRVNEKHWKWPLWPHKDSTDRQPGLIAGVIYLNFPEECRGGTAFYDDEYDNNDKKMIYKSKMTFNTMVLYQMRAYHAIHMESMEDFRDHWRIAQNFFISDYAP